MEQRMNDARNKGWCEKVSTQFAGNCEFAFRRDNPITRTSEILWQASD